jgi:hypothetical protein
MMHDVPFESQYEGITDPAWQWRGCGIVALHMILRYWHARDLKRSLPTVEDLRVTGIRTGAYRERIGWTHRGLVELAQQFGYDGFNADHASNGPTPKTPDASWRLLSDELQHWPVLASVYHYLDPAHGGGHIIVVTGFHDGLVAFNDPEEMNAREGQKAVALSSFLHGFKNRFIVIH